MFINKTVGTAKKIVRRRDLLIYCYYVFDLFCL